MKNFITTLFALLVLIFTIFAPAHQAYAFSAATALNEATFTEVVPAQTATSTVTGSAVNLIDHTGYLALTMMSEAGTGTTPTMDCKVQDSADGSTGWGDVAGATWTQVTDAADAHETILVNSDSSKQYIRGVCTIAGTTPSFAFGITMAGFKDQR